MTKFDVFVGRQKELALIDQWSQRWNTMHWILVGGQGGIGKTFLLNKVLQKYTDRDDFTVIHYDLSEQPPSTLREALHVAESIGWEHFPQFRAKITALDRGEYDIADVRLPRLEQDALMSLVDELRAYMQRKRLIRLTDTLDMPAMSEARPQFYQYGKLVPNLLGITAGRRAKEFLPQLQQALGPEQVTYIELDRFNEEESQAFFTELDDDEYIPPDLRAKLYFLTGGRPILLSLAIEWLSHDVPLPEIVETPLPDLKALPENALTDLRARFEFELVSRVRQLRRPLDRAVLYMAQIDRRCDAPVLAVLLDIPEDAAEELVEDLADMSFVKYNALTNSCVLHDEMKVLVNQYAWPYVDPTGDIRRALTNDVIVNYYQPRITDLARRAADHAPERGQPVRRAEIGPAEWELWRLEAECLHYHLKLSQVQGWDYFEERFGEAHRNNHLIRMQFLIGEMEAVDPHVRTRVELRRAESLRLSGQEEAAAAICNRVLADRRLSDENRLSAHITLGWIASASDSGQAFTHFQTALTLAQQQNNPRLAGILHNNLGQIYQSTGEFGAAIEHYQQAVRLSTQADNPILVASAKNNQAYVYRLQGDLTTADALCRVALVQRQKLRLERDLAFSYLTKADIDRDKGDLESAERYTKLALRTFDKVNEKRGQALAYCALANIHRHLHQYEKAKFHLEQALALAQQLNNAPLLATIYDVYGRAERDHASYLKEFEGENTAQVAELFAAATHHLEQNLQLSARYGNRWLLTRAKFELALTYYYTHSHTEDEVLALLADVWEQADALEYTLIQGYVEEVRGEIALRQGNYPLAARQLGLAAQLVGQFTGREAARFFDRLSDYLLDVALAPDDSVILACGILRVIGVSATDAELARLQALCAATASGAGGDRLVTTYPGGEALETLKALCQQILLQTQ